MTGRERVLKAYRHDEPDRTPIGEMYDIAPPTRWEDPVDLSNG